MIEPAHPYIPNSAPRARQSMLDALGISSPDELFDSIPSHLRLSGPLEIPARKSEQAIRATLQALMGRNRGCDDTVSFLGGGCWHHDVPAVCDEINQRAEFMTSYVGQLYTDHGKLQALFEYQSLIGELVDLDVVSLPTYDWASAASTAILMASRMTSRREVVVASAIGPERLGIIRGYCEPHVRVAALPYDPDDGRINLAACDAALSRQTACVYSENPSYLGVIDDRMAALSDRVHALGGLHVVGVDPISLGVLQPPPAYGADIVCGDLQPLGMHMHYGGGLAGFIATPDEERYVNEFPANVLGLTTTSHEGERGFGYVRPGRTIFSKREDGKEFTGTTTGLWAITAGVYLSLLGSQGMHDIGKGILQRSQYAADRIDAIPGVCAPALSGPFFKEFVVRFAADGPSVAAINHALLERGFFGGHSLATAFPELPGSALYCVTELHTMEMIDRFADGLEDVLGNLRAASATPPTSLTGEMS
jgi:glycine dehydrogenase subunit 1